jgi:hypothetical protein
MGNDDPIHEPHDTGDPERYLVGWMDVFTSSILTIYFTLYTHNNKIQLL